MARRTQFVGEQRRAKAGHSVVRLTAEEKARCEETADRMWGRFAAMTVSLHRSGMSDLEICTGAVTLALRRAISVAGDDGGAQIMRTIVGILLADRRRRGSQSKRRMH